MRGQFETEFYNLVARVEVLENELRKILEQSGQNSGHGATRKKSTRGSKQSSLENRSKDAKESQASLASIYRDHWRKRYGINYPVWGAKQNSQLKQWSKQLTRDQAKYLIQYYIAWNDPWVVKQGHPLDILVSKTTQLVTDIKAKKQKLEARRLYREEQEKLEGEVDSDRFTHNYIREGQDSSGRAKLQAPTQGELPRLSDEDFVKEFQSEGD